MEEGEPPSSLWRLGAPNPGALLGPPLLLLLLLFLSPGLLESSRYPYSEIIVPEELDLSHVSDNEVDVSYALAVEGRRRVVHLKQMTFMTSVLPVYSHNGKGDLTADYPYIQDNCYYRGYVDGTADSQVILSTCSGLWGHLQMETLRYEIEPIESSRTFQHLIYRKVAEQKEPCRGVVEGDADFASGKVRMVANESLSPSAREESTFGSRAPVRYLEYYAVVDQSKFVALNRNETASVILVTQLMANVHAMYFEIGLHVYLVGLELWTERDYIKIHAKNLYKTLTEFYYYATYELQHRVYFDHAGLITNQGSPDGLAWGEHICVHNHASVSAMRSEDDVVKDALNVAHQLGHTFGFRHDDAPESRAQHCDCGCAETGKCVMVTQLNTVKCLRLSNCSWEIYYNLIRQGKECLLNVPSKIAKPKMCGNGVVDENEECDCGFDEETESERILTFFLPKRPKAKTQQWIRWSGSHFSSSDYLESKDLTECRRNSCCQKDCTLKMGTNCVYGLCCEKCKFSGRGTLCREPASECDLPEFCNGSSADCPADVHKQDGTLCSISASCYRGKCHDLQQHCTDLFGQGAEVAPLKCFREVNMLGDRSGNCGMDRRRFKKCQEKDILCGRLQCVHVKKIPITEARQGIIQTPVEDTMCWGTEFHFGEDAYDLGAVRDGTSCGADKVCLNRSCVDRAVLNSDCDLARCNNRGVRNKFITSIVTLTTVFEVCNSNRNCHCSSGWAPPFCRSIGSGGSVDSGPPSHFRWALVLLLARSFLLILILLVMFIFAISKRKQLTVWFTKFQNKIQRGTADTGSVRREPLERVPAGQPAPLKDHLVAKKEPSLSGPGL